MNAPNEKQYLKFESELKYGHSVYDFIMKIEEGDDIYRINLIYEKEIEYSSKFKFTDLQQKFPKFKSVYHFFKFLNENRTNYEFCISQLNREYCDLALIFLDNIFNQFTFKLSNTDINKNIEFYKEQKLLKHSADDLIEMCNKSDSVILKDISFEKINNSYRFIFNDHNYIIFFQKLKFLSLLKIMNK